MPLSIQSVLALHCDIYDTLCDIYVDWVNLWCCYISTGLARIVGAQAELTVTFLWTGACSRMAVVDSKRRAVPGDGAAQWDEPTSPGAAPAPASVVLGMALARGFHRPLATFDTAIAGGHRTAHCGSRRPKRAIRTPPPPKGMGRALAKRHRANGGYSDCHSGASPFSVWILNITSPVM